MMEYRNSARGHLIALETKNALECYLEEMIKGTTMKQKAYGTLASSEVHAETVDQKIVCYGGQWYYVISQMKCELLRKKHALMATPYIRT